MQCRDAARWRAVMGWMAILLLWGALRPAAAHDVPSSVVMIDIGRDALALEVQLPLSELGAALQLPLTAEPQTVIGRYRPVLSHYILDRLRISDRAGAAFAVQVLGLELRHTNNANWTSNDWLIARVRASAPAGASTEVFCLDDTLIVHRVLSHKTLVYVRRDIRNGLVGDQPMAVGLVLFGKTTLQVDGSSGSWWRGFDHLFSLGMRHIAEGSDHILFLIALLLPAPLLVRRGQWRGSRSATSSVRSIAGVVTGFTVGHSLSLALATFGWIVVPTHSIEILIAVSILVSSVHAWRPVFAGKELWIASGFGLIHGLAFAETLAGLNFDGYTLALSLLGFNLGIECMQLLIIAVVMPILLWLSARPAYRFVRSTGAAFAGVCAIGWMMERAFNLPNPLAPLVNWLSPPPLWFVCALCALSALCLGLMVARTGVRSRPVLAARF